MKKVLSVFIVCVLLASLFTPSAFAADEITVKVNGEVLKSDVPAQTLPVYDENGGYVGDRVMLPIRAISEKLNCDVWWNAENGGITLYRKNNLYIMWVGKETAFHLNGPAMSDGYNMDTPPTIIDSRTLIPVRAAAEILGAEVEWIGESKTVEISFDLGELEENQSLAEQCEIYERLLLQQYEIYKGFVEGTIDTVPGKIVLESGEEIKFELYPEMAPVTCEKFIGLAKGRFYDHTVFHRVIEGFVAQGGGYSETGEYKDSEPILGEFVMNGIMNLIPHRRGTLSLARAEDSNSGTNQFFIVQEDSPSLDGYYAGFGRITEGMEIVDKICSAETDEAGLPVEPIVVKEIVIFE